MRVLPSLRRVGTFLWIGVALLTAIGLMRTVSAQAPPRLSRDAVLNHLNAAITWYRDSTNKVHAVGLPSDAIYEDNARNLAGEAVRLAFQSARAEAALIDAGSKDQSPSESSKPSQQDFHQMAANTSAQRIRLRPGASAAPASVTRHRDGKDKAMNNAPVTLIRRVRALAVLTLVAAMTTAAFTSTSSAKYAGRLLGGGAGRRASRSRRRARAGPGRAPPHRRPAPTRA